MKECDETKSRIQAAIEFAEKLQQDKDVKMNYGSDENNDENVDMLNAGQIVENDVADTDIVTVNVVELNKKIKSMNEDQRKVFDYVIQCIESRLVV